jgi:YVTN family beta-propeller protein
VANNNPDPEPQPHRDRPARAVLSSDGTRLYVTLQGTESDPGHEVAVVDVETHSVIKRIPVGRRPYQPVLHPGGRFLVVTNELSNYMTVIDTRTDEAIGRIPLDYYAQGLVFSASGEKAWVAIRYLGQVLVLNMVEQGDRLVGHVEEVGGFGDQAFYGRRRLPKGIKDELTERQYAEDEIEMALGQGVGGINSILRARCKGCHNQPAGGFQVGPDRESNLLSAVENSIPGEPYRSPLLRAVLPKAMGGFGDVRVTPEFHPGGVLFEQDDPDLEVLVDWIRSAVDGPGITVGNPQSHPKDLVLSRDGRYLFVANTGTMDISIIDTRSNKEVGAFYIQNVANHLALYRDEENRRDLLIAMTMGAGFGAPKERDPYGAETWDRDNPAAQFTVLRDPRTTDAYPIEQQYVMGPFDAIDGTWNFKMRDIQNDLVVIDLSRVSIPEYAVDRRLDYLVKANRYEAHDAWVRYTSDTAEATTGDIKGDIPPELQRVHGAFPQWAAIDGDRLFVTMGGSFELVEWKIAPDADDPANKLVPIRSYATGLRPVGIVIGKDGPSKNNIFVINQLSEDITVFHRAGGQTRRIIIGNGEYPPLSTDAEKGEFIAHSTGFSSDGDTSCEHCHYRDTGDGRAWGAAETVGQDVKGHLTPGGTLGIPQIKALFAIEPYYFEGTHLLAEGQGADINEPMSSIDFDRPIWAGDFSAIVSAVPPAQRRLMHEELKERVEVRKLGKEWYDLERRRAVFIGRQSEKYFGRRYELKDLYRFMAAWMANETRLFPNPFDRENPSVKRGKRLFNSAQVMCGVCHTAPDFTNKTAQLANNDRRALPTLTTITRRDASYTLVSVHAMEAANGDPIGLEHEDRGRIETPEGSFTTMQLRGLFDRPPVFLHHGRARSLREVILTPGHPAARAYRYPVYQGDEEVRPQRMEIGFNETTSRTHKGELAAHNTVIDTHGGTSHLTPRQLEDLLHFMETIE